MGDYPTSTLDVSHPERGKGPRQERNRRIGYGVMTFLLVALVSSAVVDDTTGVDIWGVSTDTVTATGGGYVLEVRYPTVTRPALATPFAVVIHRDGGFSAPVEVAVASEFLEMWDFQALYPSPTGEVATPQQVTFTFDPPDGEEMRIFLDARIQPAQQSGTRGFVSVLDGDGDPAATAHFETTVRP